MEDVYAPIIVLSLVGLSILAALVVKELKTMNAVLRTLGVDTMKTRLEDLRPRKKVGSERGAIPSPAARPDSSKASA